MASLLSLPAHLHPNLSLGFPEVPRTAEITLSLGYVQMLHKPYRLCLGLEQDLVVCFETEV